MSVLVVEVMMLILVLVEAGGSYVRGVIGGRVSNARDAIGGRGSNVGSVRGGRGTNVTDS